MGSASQDLTAPDQEIKSDFASCSAKLQILGKTSQQAVVFMYSLAGSGVQTF